MNPILRNILAIISGLLVGSSINMLIIIVSGSIIPPPKGADITTMEGLKNSIHLFEAKHFIMPFLAHALGTLAGALITSLIATPKQKMRLALIIGSWFLIGGIANIFMLPSPIWFNIIDLVFAYIPMGYLGGKLFIKKQ